MSFPAKLSLLCVSVVIAICAAVCIGWLIDSSWLKTGLLDVGAVAMNPVTAVALVLASTSIILSRSETNRGAVRVGRLLGAVVATIGLIKLVDYIFGFHSGLDRWLFAQRIGENRMAPNTAGAFLIMGLALMLLDARSRARFAPAQLLAAAITVLGFLCLVGYAFRARSMYGVGPHIPMALNTALSFELLALAVLLCRPDRGIVAELRSSAVGGIAARRLLPVAILLPIVFGWLCEYGRHGETYVADFAAALMVTGTVVMFAAAVCWTAVALNAADGRRVEAENRLRIANEELDRRVSQRTAELVEANLDLAKKNHEVGMFRLMVESVQDYAFLILDPQGCIVSWNAGAERITGYRAVEIIGRHVSVFLPPTEVADDAWEPTRQTAAVEGRCEEEGLRVRKDGSQFWANVVVTAIRNAEGRLAGFAKVTRDLTERRLAEASAARAADDLKKRDDQLRQSQKMEAVGTLAGGVAHEFNNLLQAMQAYTQFAMEGLMPEEPRYQDLQQVLAATDRAATLTRQLLGFGRRQALELKDVEPNGLVQDLLKLVQPLIGANIVVDVSLDPKVGLIHADASQFQQLMMNLCVNARDAMPDGGTLLIKSEDLHLTQHYCDVHPGIEPGRYLALTVSDTGTGMPPEVAEHIFEPFFTTKGLGKGTGLGLSMVYGMVQQHHGVIRTYSEVGHGTTFKILLPTVACASASTGTTATSPERGGVETILVADDEASVHDVYLRVLGRAGYRLLSARDGREAWEVFESHADEIDLMVLDIMMPNQTGRDVYRRVRDVRAEMPILFCSGYDPATTCVRFAEGDGLRFIQKPFDPDDLLRSVRQLLDQAALGLNDRPLQSATVVV